MHDGGDPCAGHCSRGPMRGTARVRLVSVCAALEPDELASLEALAPPGLLFGQADDFLQGGACRLSLQHHRPRGAHLQATAGRQASDRRLLARPATSSGSPSRRPMASRRTPSSRWSPAASRGPPTRRSSTRSRICLRRLHEVATDELTQAQEQMMLLGRRTAEERLVAFLLSPARALGAAQRRATLRRPAVAGRQDIADYIGLTIETVSRTFTKLAKEKTLLIVPDGVRPMNLRAWKRLAAA